METEVRVTLSIDGGTATLTLDSPANRNALTPELLEAAISALETAESSDAAVLVMAATGPAFCAGMDLRETDPVRLRAALERLLELLSRLTESRLPVVARVHGPARAAGAGLLGCADYVVCAEDVDFAFTEVRLGLAPAVVSATVLPRLAPRAGAHLLLSAASVTAAAARDLGLVTHVAPHAELDALVAAVCEPLLLAHPQGMRETRRLVNADLARSLRERGRELVDTSVRLFTSTEAREAIAAARRR